MKSTVYLSLGGNEGQVLSRLKHALTLLSCRQEIVDLKFSHFYQTSPFQVESSDWFINAVCSFQTFLPLEELFKITKSIESQLGKVGKPKSASRPIDIDLLFYGSQIYATDELVIPHPHWKERLFVLIPLMDLTKEVMIHGQEGEESYAMQDLIQLILIQSSQTVSLLEKNPGIQ
jgi:2-amino-4-hydroxy-6-hydroxymethyldihydropteridine diphosphokinase